jgi:hypothetical protein
MCAVGAEVVSLEVASLFGLPPRQATRAPRPSQLSNPRRSADCPCLGHAADWRRSSTATKLGCSLESCDARSSRARSSRPQTPQAGHLGTRCQRGGGGLVPVRCRPGSAARVDRGTSEARFRSRCRAALGAETFSVQRHWRGSDPTSATPRARCHRRACPSREVVTTSAQLQEDVVAQGPNS